MNILFLFVSIPNLDNQSNLWSSLIHEFKNNGHNVYVSTKSQIGSKSYLSNEDGISVLRIQSHDFTGVKSSIKKALGYQEYSIKQAFLTYKYFKHVPFDLIISHSLPPELPIIIGYLKARYRCPFYLIQTDFIWQDAVAFNYFSKNSLVACYYRLFEKKMFQQADYIGCPTKGNISFIKKYYPNIDESKFRFLPFWQKNIHPNSVNNSIKKKYGLENKFVVVYGGSVGASQRIEHFLELADACREFNDISFVILGRGVYLNNLKHMASNMNLSNIIFKDFMPQEDYLIFLSSCDVGMIILNEKMATPNFPSKALSYLNMKVPILAALDHTTDFGNYLEENNSGLWAYSDDIYTLKSKLLLYYSNQELREQVKNNGYNLFIEHLTPDSAYTTIFNDFKND